LKKTLAVIPVIPLCVAFIMTVSAQTKGTRAVFTGEVVRIDEIAQTISVKDSEGVEVFDTKNAMFDEDFGLSDFLVGDVVELEFEEKDGKKSAIVIMLKPITPATEAPLDEPEEGKVPVGSPANPTE